jgi:2-oxoglutarate ferredoxin oxidoreductase subunit gamma
MYHEIRIQGSGGQGIITAGRFIGEAAALHEHKEAIMTEDYSPFVTGGWSRADLVIADQPIDYPLVTHPTILVAMTQDALESNWDRTASDATMIVDSRCIVSRSLNGRRLFNVPALNIAEELGSKRVANLVMLGVLTAKTQVVNRATMESVIEDRYPNSVELNLQAFARGFNHT